MQASVYAPEPDPAPLLDVELLLDEGPDRRVTDDLAPDEFGVAAAVELDTETGGAPTDELRWTAPPTADPDRDPGPELDPEPPPTRFEPEQVAFAPGGDPSVAHATGPNGTGTLAPPTPSASSAATVATLRSSPAVTFETSRTHLVASLPELRRVAADGWVQVEIVHRASQGQAVASLRLTVSDLFGGCEYHDVPGRVSSGIRRAILVDAAELLQAVQVDPSPDNSLSLVLDGDVTVGRVLVLGRDVPAPDRAGERRKIERIDLPEGGRDGAQLDTLAGRFIVPSRVASSLRSRRARDIDLIMIGDQAFLAARVPGPTSDVTATIETPLRADAAELPETVSDRRDRSDSAVDQLIRALSVGSSPEELVAITTHGVGYARRRAAAHPDLPADVIIAMLHDGTEAMRSAAAANPNIPPSAIERAVTDHAASVRAAVAVNPRVPPALLFRLLRDDSAQVRLSVARNQALPPGMLALLADDADATVRAAVPAHESCPVEVLGQLAGDQFAGVCASVAENPNCPAETLEQLLSIVPEVVLSNPRSPEHLLVAGSQVASPLLRAAVAANPATPARELQSLARDADRVVVRAVAENPNAPANVRRRARRRSERAGTSKPHRGHEAN